MVAPTITVFEGGRLEFPLERLGERLQERLLGLTVGGKQAFAARKGNIYATDLVGAVDLGEIRVEILPKPYGVNSEQEARQLMFDLLRWAGTEINPEWLVGGSDARNTDLLRVVAERSAEELLRRLEVGTARRYQGVRERSPVLRGRIEFGAYIRQLPSDAHLLPVTYSPLTADNDLGRLLKALATRLRDKSDSYRARRALDRCLDLLAEVQFRPLTPELVQRVRLGRMETEWKGLVDLAALLASGRSPDPASLGDTRQTTLLFPMSRLFEALIRQVLATSMTPPLACLRSPGEHALLTQVENASSQTTALAIRPDLLFSTSRQIIATGDVKWKRLSENPPRHSVTPGDVYQLLAYMRLFDVSTGILFFPRTDWMPPDWETEYRIAPAYTGRIKVMAVDLPELIGGMGDDRKRGALRLAARTGAVLRSPEEPVESSTGVRQQHPSG